MSKFRLVLLDENDNVRPFCSEVSSFENLTEKLKKL